MRQRLKLARASQDIYLRCKECFSEFKTRQLIELYKAVYNLTIAAEPPRNRHPELQGMIANERFKKSLGPFGFGVLSLFEFFDGELAPAFLKDRLRRIFLETNENAVLPNFLTSEAMQRDVQWIKQGVALEETLDWYARALDLGSIKSEVETLSELWTLIRIVRENRIDVTIRQVAAKRMDILTQDTRLSGMGTDRLLEMARDEGDEKTIDRIRTQLFVSGAHRAHTPYLYRQLGLHALTADDFESAQKHFLNALTIGKGNISGNIRGELSLHLWSLRRYLKQNVNPGQEEVWEKDIKMFAFETNIMSRNPPIGDWYSLWCKEHLG